MTAAIITVFSISQCPHCTKAKGALKERGWEYQEISLTSYPSKRSDMLSLSDSLTVPQIFFKDELIVGGASGLLDKLTALDSSSGDKGAAFYKDLLSQGPSGDKRLEFPTTPPVADAIAPSRTEEVIPKIKLPYLDVAKKLSSSTSLNDSCFPLSSLETELINIFKLSKSHAFKVSKVLQENKMVVPSSNDTFMLAQFATPKVLNSYRTWNDVVDTKDPLALLSRIKKLYANIEKKYQGSDGLVDYENLALDADYPTFEEATCELQGLDMKALDKNTTIAFCINLYNIMIKHAYAKVGIPDSKLNRGPFFSAGPGYQIGEWFFTFDDLENGILRSKNFKEGDPRKVLELGIVEPRIHFALNCGAKSCPPIKKFSADAIDEELRIVAMAYTEGDDNVMLDEEKNTLFCNQIFNWYGVDFGQSDAEKATTILKFIRSKDKREKLEEMIKKEGFKVDYLFYDWSSDAKVVRSYIVD